MMFGMLFFWGLLAALLIGGGLVVVWLAGDRHPVVGKGHTATPRQILDERLARGEIDQAEYEALRAKV
jgi:putative membrane protein